jgi:hypothetical protein
MEGYPKVWGHGSVDGRNIPERKILDKREIMIDRHLGGNEIKSQVNKIPARQGFTPVPNMGKFILTIFKLLFSGRTNL